MNIITTRRISQIFFFIVFIWFCLVTTIGDQWWQLRGWPVNWIIQLDPLVGLATLLSTRTLFAGLLWGLATVVLTIILGRFFCGWLCPFGAIHQFVGYIANRKKKVAAKIKLALQVGDNSGEIMFINSGADFKAVENINLPDTCTGRGDFANIFCIQ